MYYCHVSPSHKAAGDATGFTRCQQQRGLLLAISCGVLGCDKRRRLAPHLGLAMSGSEDLQQTHPPSLYCLVRQYAMDL